MAMDKLTTSRRTVIAAMLAAPAAGAIAALPATVAPTGELTAKIAKVRRGMAAAREHDTRVGGPASKRLQAAKAAWERACDAIPHTSFAGRPQNSKDTMWTTANRGQLVVAEAIAPGTYKHRPDVIADAKRLIEAEAKREQERQRLREVYGVPATKAEWDRVCDETDALRDLWLADETAVFAHPCTTAAELEQKLSYAEEQDYQNTGFLTLLLADARRIAKREAN